MKKRRNPRGDDALRALERAAHAEGTPLAWQAYGEAAARAGLLLQSYEAFFRSGVWRYTTAKDIPERRARAVLWLEQILDIGCPFSLTHIKNFALKVGKGELELEEGKTVGFWTHSVAVCAANGTAAAKTGAFREVFPVFNNSGGFLGRYAEIIAHLDGYKVASIAVCNQGGLDPEDFHEEDYLTEEYSRTWRIEERVWPVASCSQDPEYIDDKTLLCFGGIEFADYQNMFRLNLPDFVNCPMTPSYTDLDKVQRLLANWWTI